MRTPLIIAKVAAAMAVLTFAAPAVAQVGGSGAPANAGQASANAARQTEYNRNAATLDLGDRRNATQRRQLPAAQVRSETVAALTAKGVSCGFQRAAFLGETAGKENTFEVVCDNGPGYVVVAGSAPQAFNCVALAGTATQLRARDPEAEVGTQCSLPENTDIAAAVTPLATAAGLDCTVDSAKWLGEIDGGQRYEIGCANKIGYWLDTGPNGAPTSTIDCVRLIAAGKECSLTTPAEQAAYVTQKFGGQGAADCTVESARFAGANGAGEQFYEVKCASGEGYFYQAAADGSFKQAIPCVNGAGLGGCKLLDAATLAAQTLDTHKALMSGTAISCSATGSRAMGTETNVGREVVEFTCSDRPLGLIGLFPKNGAGADYGVEAMDCLTASWRSLTCELTPADQIKATLSSMLQAGGANCDVTAFRVFARNSGNNGDRAEVKCAAGGGFVADFGDSRTGAARANPCDRLPESDPVCRL